MNISSPFRRVPLLPLALFAAALTPMACALKTSGQPGDTSSSSGGGDGGTGGMSSSSSSSSATTGGGGTGGSMCAPGDMRTCYPAAAATENVGVCHAGMETCMPDGMGYGPCMGAVIPKAEDCAAMFDENCDGSVNEGCPCTPNASESCYSGPAGTESVGICHAGMHTCNPDGMGYGPCSEQTPKLEDCATPEDEDCDGSSFSPLDTDCACVPGAMSTCYSGPVATQNVGICQDGMHTCNADGKTFGQCVGEVLPGIEDCKTPIDEDCDGKVFNDSNDGCVCQPGSSDVCNTGSMGVCAAGTHTCAADGKGYAGCLPTTPASFDDCNTPEDEDCDGATPLCAGDPLLGGGFGNGNLGTDEVAYAAGTDSMGNRVAGGVWAGTVNGYGVSAGAAFVLKAPPVGNPVFTKTLAPNVGAGNYAVVRGVGSDSTGAVVIGGEYQGTVDFGGGALVSGGVDVFIAKYGTNGAFAWAKRFGDGMFQAVTAVAVDGPGNVYVAGQYTGAINFGNGGNIGGAMGLDAFVAKFDSSGTHLWSKKIGDAASQAAWGIALTPQNDVVIVGEFAGTVSFGGGNITSTGGVDAFVAKLKGSDGSQLWAKKFGDAQDQYAYGVAVDPAGNVAVTGAFYGGIDFGGGTLNNADAGNTAPDIFVARLNGSNGNHIWSKRFGDNKFQIANGVAVDPAGNVSVAGYFRGTVNFGGVDLVDADATNTTNDAFVARLSAATGAHLWSKRYGDAADQRLWAVASTLTGHEVVAGGYQGTIDFGAPVGQFTSGGGYDIMGVELSP